jgi:hypothetical protein
MKLNDWTFLISVFFLPIWLVWELVALWLRSKGVFGGGLPGTSSMNVAVISTVMQHRGYQANVLPFFWSAMMAHWWWNWVGWKTWSTPYPAIAFWMLVAGTLALDISLWKTPYETLHPVLKFYRAPMMQCVAGFLTAFFLFPQQAIRASGWRWW